MDQHGEIILYQSEDGLTKLDVKLHDETVWLSLDQMAELFGRDKSTISRHIRNVFAEGELNAAATVANFATVQTEGDRQVSRDITYYNLVYLCGSLGFRTLYSHCHLTPVLEAEYDPAVMMHGHMIHYGVPALEAEFHVQLIQL